MSLFCASTINYWNYFLCLWLFLSLVLASGLQRVRGENLKQTSYSLLLIGSYSAIYLLPTILISTLLTAFPVVNFIITILLSIITIGTVFVNGRLYDLYGFHFNKFVYNLLITPGGFDSLGADQTNPLMLMKYIAILIIGMVVSICVGCVSIHYNAVCLLLVFCFMTMSERILYGFAYARAEGFILSQADYFIFHQPLKMNKLLRKYGYRVAARDKAINMDNNSAGRLNYPLNPLVIEYRDKPYNIIILVAESLREAQVANTEIMPNTMAFAEKYGSKLNQHYAGGNGTRESLFSLFYGLYGSYWNVFLRERCSPVLFEVMNQYDYQYFLYTGARFTYPEFDKTIFASVSSEKLIETSQGEPWQRDEKNISMLLQDMENRNLEKPFFGFVFFESTHARYSFPETHAIKTDYLQTLDYATLSRAELASVIDGVKSRYLNAAHYVDSQYQRVYHYLETNGLLENTIVIATGDHGEEFMEHSRWGHNSSFVNEQIQVPMVISHPEKMPNILYKITSHTDIPVMLLESLGVTNPSSDYSLGQSLLNQQGDMAVVASWSDLGIISSKGKLVIPFKRKTQHRHLATTLDDIPTHLGELSQKMFNEIGQVISNANKFMV